MSTYKGIFGKTIKHLSSDPNNTTYEGQVWYNTTEGKFKTVVATAAWSSAASLINNHGEHIGGSGSGTDGLAFGGEGPTNYDLTEEWNGTGFAAGGAYPFAGESIMGCGDSGPSSIAFGGINNASPGVRQTVSATYDGSSWTATNSLPTAKRSGQGFGTNTAAVAAGGDTPSSPDPQTSVEEWDGTNWTAVNAMPAGKGNMGGGTGSQTAGLVFGGGRPSPSAPATTDTYSYDGTNWTTVANMNTGRNQTNGWGGPAGQTASVCAGGSTGSVSSATENWDGTAWSTSPATLAAARQGSANGIGTSSSNGIQAGGYTTAYVSSVEEYNFTANTVTAGAWASANPQPNAWSNQTGTGNTNSGIIVGGDTGGSFPSWPTQTTEFDGTNWSSGGAYPTAGNKIGFCGGAFAEMMGVGGNQNGPVINTVNTYDGSTWTTSPNNYPISVAGVWGAGTNTAALWFGGGTNPHGGSPIKTDANSWNGSSWTSETAIPQSRAMHRTAGTSTALVAWGATSASGAPPSSSEEYDGSSWTAGGTNVYDMVSGGQAGTQTAAFGYSPYNSPFLVASKYDGTAWSTMPNMSTSRPSGSGFGTSTSSAIAAGYFPNVGTTEEFTGETTSINIESVDNS